MRTELIRPRDLSRELCERWASWLTDDPALASPYFRPEFTQVVAGVRDDVRIAVVEDGNDVVAFLPLHLNRWKVGRPIGLCLSDFHGVIAAEGVVLSPGEMLRDVGMRAWRFDHLLASQESFAAWSSARAESPYLDLSAGFPAWRRQRGAAGASSISQIERKMRKAEREAGPLRLEFQTSADTVFDALLRWKREQRRRTGVYEIFGVEWVLELLHRLRAADAIEFSGVLSALWLGDELAAVHFGLRSRSVLHWWFPSYNSDLEKYSPGLILLLELARVAADDGVSRIDLGKGPERYKASFASASIPLLEGAVDRRPGARWLWDRWYQARDWSRTTPLRDSARIPLSVFRQVRGWMAAR